MKDLEFIQLLYKRTPLAEIREEVLKSADTKEGLCDTEQEYVNYCQDICESMAMRVFVTNVMRVIANRRQTP